MLPGYRFGRRDGYLAAARIVLDTLEKETGAR